MPGPARRALARPAAVSAAILLAGSALGQRPNPGPSHRAAGEREIAAACRAALQELSAADAAGIGLLPVAEPLAFDGETERTTRVDGALVVEGRAAYRPTYRVPALPVRWECAADPATKAVRSARYAAVDASGAEIASSPAGIVRDAVVLEACRPALEEEVREEAVKRGARAGGGGFEADATSISTERKGKLLDLSGRGRARLSKDFEWQAVTFGCRWDEKKEKTSKTWVSPADAPRLGVLSPERQELLDGCKAAVAEALWDDAARRGYRWPRDEVVVELERFGDFAAAGKATAVEGEGSFRSDARHRESTPITFRCVSDPVRGGVASATFELKEASRTPSGEIASGKTATLVCEAYGKGQKVCPARIRGSVKIVRELGPEPCKAYGNWIWSLEGITVWGGCAAEFEFEAR